jgi:hypothetical protein
VRTEVLAAVRMSVLVLWIKTPNKIIPTFGRSTLPLLQDLRWCLPTRIYGVTAQNNKTDNTELHLQIMEVIKQRPPVYGERNNMQTNGSVRFLSRKPEKRMSAFCSGGNN